MYLLKVENAIQDGDSFQYFRLPDKFTSSIYKYDYIFLAKHSNKPIVVWSSCQQKEGIGELLENPKYPDQNEVSDAELYKFENGWKQIEFVIDDKPTNIFFNGRAYLLKENGKTIETL